MTTKEKLIAYAIRRFHDDDERAPIHSASAAVDFVATAIADELETHSETFDRVKFLEACGVRP